MKKHAVVVYINTKDGKSLENLSPVVTGALYAKSMGNIIPKAVVTSPDQKTYMASIAYKSMKDSKSFRDANKQVKSVLDGAVVEVPKDLVYAWTIRGKRSFVVGEFMELKDDKTVLLKTPNGRTRKMSLDQLTPGCGAYARVMAGGGDEEVSSGKRELEPWTNTKGKQIHARFISLKDGKIRLEQMNGKVVTFSISLLSEESQKRAKELAGE
ncbi:MAG: SHD1 domain-containing protein [Myxococcota bacterium]